MRPECHAITDRESRRHIVEACASPMLFLCFFLLVLNMETLQTLPYLKNKYPTKPYIQLDQFALVADHLEAFANRGSQIIGGRVRASPQPATSNANC